MTDLHILDLGIIAFYFFAIVMISVAVMRKTQSGDDLFLAGRSLGWGVIGFSLFASNISSTTLIGLAGSAYSTGIAVANYEWMAGLILVFMSFFVIPVFLKKQIATVPHYLQYRYTPFTRKYFSGLTILMSIIVDAAGGIYAGALVLQIFFPGISLAPTCIAIAIFAGLYTAAGGLKAVVFTDVIQAVILIIGSCFITYFVFQEYDFSWTNARETIPEGHLSLIKPLDDETLPWLGTLIGVPILGFWYWATNQYITQRILGAKSVSHAQWGANLAGLLKLLPLFIMVLPGAMAIGLYEGQIDDSDKIFPQLIIDYLPIGFKGLVIAGLFAAIMSTIDSTLNSASTLIIKDFVEKDNRALTAEQERRWGRFATLVLMAVAAAWAPQIADFKGLFAYLQQAFAVVVPPVAAIFLMGLFWRRGTGKAAVTTLLLGHATCLAVFILGQMNIWTLHFTITVGIMTAYSVILFILVSLITNHSEKEDHEALWAPALSKVPQGKSLWQDYRTQAAIVITLTAIMLIAFW